MHIRILDSQLQYGNFFMQKHFVQYGSLVGKRNLKMRVLFYIEYKAAPPSMKLPFMLILNIYKCGSHSFLLVV
jgi:hypothetical protein